MPKVLPWAGVSKLLAGHISSACAFAGKLSTNSYFGSMHTCLFRLVALEPHFHALCISLFIILSHRRCHNVPLLSLQDPAAVLNEVGLLAGLRTLSAWRGAKLRLSLTTLSLLWRQTGNDNIYMVGISLAWKSMHSQSIIHIIFKLLLSKAMYYEWMLHDLNSIWLLEFTNLWEEIFIGTHTYMLCMDGCVYNISFIFSGFLNCPN